MTLKTSAAALAAACLVATGCSSDSSGLQTSGKTYSLTVFAYDAVTGAPIPTAALTSGLSLYEESTKVNPTALNSNVNGAVIFNGIPADYAGQNGGYNYSASSTGFNKVFPLIGNVEGYQAYQGSVSFSVGLNGNGSASYLQDDLFAQVGTIYLFPTGYQAPDYTFTVVYNGKPVPNAVVELDPGAAASVTEKDNTSSPITTVSGHSAALTATTDTNGKVTFAGSTLALGVTYKVTLLPVTFEGVQLAESTNSITVGSPGTNAVQTISASALVPGTTGLYVVRASNQSYQLDATGTLTIVFSRPVALTANNGGFIQNSGGTNGVLAATPNVSLSADGLTLTLTPSWTTAPTTVSAGATVSYGGGSVYVVGYPALGTFTVFNLQTIPTATSTGAPISGTVQLKAN